MSQKHYPTRTLKTSPQESLHALKSAVAGRFNWRILTGGDDERPRFVIEKQVRYDFARGVSTAAVYRITGGFQKSASGETTLLYAVTGESWTVLFHAALHMGIAALLLGGIVFMTITARHWLGIPLLGVLIAILAGYGMVAYRSYQGHLRELNRFMEEFVQKSQAAAS